MNYDFKTNWVERVLPVLKTKPIQNAIKRGIKRYLRDCDINETYERTKLPYYYATGDYHSQLHMRDDEKLEADLIEKCILQKDPNMPAGNDDCDFDEYQESENASKYQEYKDNIMNPYIKERIDNQYQSYQCFGACHWYNPTFGLTLARIVLPNETWIILTDELHTTVTNKTRTLVFDILYYDENEADFGGKRALRDSGWLIGG